uniref:Putative DNA primase n=1 Tax=viral metagenome TaxID=1070528 RepID=A0A6M3JVA6_9ZZZZ
MKTSDANNAGLLIEQFDGNMLYCPEMRSWYGWDGKRWVPDSGQIYQVAKRVAGVWDNEAKECDNTTRKNLLKFSAYCESLVGLKAMIHLAQMDADIQINTNAFDRNPMVLNADNGMIDMEAMKYVDFDSREFITHKADVSYVRGARNKIWESFLEDIIPSEETRLFVQAAVGYSVTGLTNEDKVFILFGDGCNGKSTFVSTIINLLGTYASQASSDLLLRKRSSGPRNDMFVLMGKRFVAATETGESCQLDENVIKQMTSGERVSVNPKYKSQLEFTPTWKTWLSTNHEPSITGTDFAIRRRLLLIPFNVQIPSNKIDVKLRTYLANNYEGRSGILNWILDGVQLWRDNGLLLPEQVLNFTKCYHDDQDSIGHFVTERCIVEEGAMVAKNTLFSAYVAYCKQVNEKIRTKNAFGRYFKSENFSEVRDAQSRCWVGVRLDDRIEIYSK